MASGLVNHPKLVHLAVPSPANTCLQRFLRCCVVCVSSVTVCRVLASSSVHNAWDMLSTCQVDVAIPFAYSYFHKMCIQFAWSKFNIVHTFRVILQLDTFLGLLSISFGICDTFRLSIYLGYHNSVCNCWGT